MQRFAIDNNPYLKNASPGAIAYVERVVEFNRKLIAALAAAKVTVVAGTDALLPGIIGGFGMHDELELLTQAGMTNQHSALLTCPIPNLSPCRPDVTRWSRQSPRARSER